MELKDVKIILSRVKVNYPTFVNDEYTQSEWYKELKDYSLEDVMQKLEQHFRSEQYGNSIPKVYFLTKYLDKEKDKGGNKNFNFICSNCHKSIKYENYDKHYDRCNSIEYLINVSKQHYGKTLNREKLEQATDEVFNDYYWKFKEKLYDDLQNGIIELSPIQKRSLKNSLLEHNGEPIAYSQKKVLSC